LQDIIEPDYGEAVYQDWQCADEVRLTATDQSDDAVALLNGRFRRGWTCVTDLVGGSHRRWTNYVRLLFPNMTRAGPCDSRVTIFFKGHAPLQHPIPADDPWTDGLLDGLAIPDEPPPPREVVLHLWYEEPGNQPLAQADVEVARNIFSDNWSGYRLAEIHHSGAFPAGSGCAPAGLQRASVNVYYLSGSFQRGSHCRDVDTDVIRVFVGPQRHNSELAHQLGHALGLTVVSLMDGFDQPESNLMWEGADVTLRKRITLGQIFRMHFAKESWVNLTSGGIDCAAPGASCPARAVDRTRSS
jgi:hypothetical protein